MSIVQERIISLHTDFGADQVSTWVLKQRSACRGVEHLVNPTANQTSCERRQLRSGRL